MIAGLVTAAVVLLAGTAFGLWRRSTDGRFRLAAASSPRASAVPASAGPSSDGPASTAPAFAGHASDGPAPASDGHASDGPAPASAGSASNRPASDGPASSVPTSDGPASAEPAFSAPASAEPASAAHSAAGSGPGEAKRLDPETLAALGVDPAAEATLLQFSSAFCQPCRAVRRVSAEVAAMVPGVRHVEVDAESHLEVVRALDIWRTPTLLVLDGDGREVKRATGVPGKPQLIAALGQVLDR